MYRIEYSKQSIRALRRMVANTAALIRSKIVAPATGRPPYGSYNQFATSPGFKHI